jgi:hypothetical protein
LKVLDESELVIEFEKGEDFQKLQETLEKIFNKEVDIERIIKK